MRLLPGLRKRAAKRPRRLVGLLTLVWVGVVVQPCAMAFGGAPAAACAHCPPAAHDAGQAQHAHAGAPEHAATSHAAHTESTHGAAAAEMPTAADAAHGAGDCGELLGDCYVLRDAEFDSRSPVAKVKDSPLELPALLPASMHTPAGPSRAACAHDYRPLEPPPGARRSLTVLYCVYLK